jgi:membrane protein YdbS with pleckstrin-like domain
MPENTQQGIAALKTGDKQNAAKLLRLAVQEDPKDLQAWLWLSGAVDTNRERIECLQNVLKIDPNNHVAARGLAQLVSQGVVNLQPVTPNAAPSDQQKNRSQREKIIFKDHPAWGFMLVVLGVLAILFWFLFYYLFKGDSSGLLIGLFGCPVGIVFVVTAVRVVALWATSKYTLTNKKLIVEKGLFTHQRKVIPVEKIQDVGYHRDFIQILFGVGDVIVESAGERGQVALRHLRKYREHSETILSLIQKT